MPGIYVTSKVKHAAMWLSLRESGVPVISTWIDDTQDAQSKLRPDDDAAWEDLWRRCIDEAATCDALVAYVEPDDVLKGGLVEIGAALSNGRPVFAVGTFAGSFCRHRLVTQCSSVSEAVNKATQAMAAARHPMDHDEVIAQGLLEGHKSEVDCLKDQLRGCMADLDLRTKQRDQAWRNIDALKGNYLASLRGIFGVQDAGTFDEFCAALNRALKESNARKSP